LSERHANVALVILPSLNLREILSSPKLSARMKWTFLVLISALCLLLSGCAMMSKSDQEFYGSGWLNPKTLDDPGQ
jgi:hypothetical protein